MTRAKFNTKKTFQDSKPRTGGDDNKKLEDMVDTLKLPEKEYVSMRLIGPAIPYAQHWIEFHSSKGKDVKIPKICLAFDPDTEDFDSSKKCPYCDNGNKAGVAYLTNAIIRDLQENEPSKKGKPSASEKETGFKEKTSKCWTPVRVVRITSTVASKFQNLSNANKVKNKKTGESEAKPLSDEKYGRDIQMLYDSKQAGSAKYDVQKGDERTPLTEEEGEYLLWNIEGLFEPEDLARAKQEAAKFFGKGGKKGDDGDYDEDDDMPKGKKGKKSKKDKDDYLDSDEEEAPKAKKGKKSKKDSDSDEEPEDSDEDAGSDSEEDEPKAKKGKKGKPGLKADDSDDDGFSDSDEEPEDSDEDEPKAKKGKKPAAKKGKKAADSDSDEEPEDSDSDEEEAPKAKKGKGKKKADSDSDEEPEDSDEDEPKAKKGKDKKAKGKKSKKSADSDEDDVDLDDLDEASDEDEPKAKKVKGKKSSKKSKKAADSDEEDSDSDDIPF